MTKELHEIAARLTEIEEMVRASEPRRKEEWVAIRLLNDAARYADSAAMHLEIVRDLEREDQ